jgi:RNA polymerase-binding transcription factor DksA
MIDTETFAERLRNERADLIQSLQHLTETLATSQLDSGGEVSLKDQHPADAASETEARELDISRKRVLEDRLELIDDALARIEAGTYGRCVVCGKPIPAGRLEALPETPYCLEHATQS